jgi:hypothetical protein
MTTPEPDELTKLLDKILGNMIPPFPRWWRDPAMLHKMKRAMVLRGMTPVERIDLAEGMGCPHRKQYYGFFGD